VTATFTGPAPTPTPRPPLDHFQCYDVHNTSTAPIGTVTAIDEFGPASGATLALDRPKRLCNPADKNGEDPTAPDDLDHLVGYKIRARDPVFAPRNMTATDQFGSLSFHVLRPDLLLVPSAKTKAPAPTPVPGAYVAGIDHYTCYRVVGARRRETVTVTDEFLDHTAVDLKRPLHYCVPTDKNGSGIKDATSHLTCYQARVRRVGGFHPPNAVAIDNQFGPDSLSSFRATELCVPSVAGTLVPCQPGCAGAHCVPVADLGTLPVTPASCTAAGGADGECVPDSIVAAGAQFAPNTCVSIAGAEGRCLSTCLPAVAARAAELPQSGCAADERCMPCFDPTASDPNAATGACGFDGDAPANPPVFLTCPWSGPAVFEPTSFAACSPTCSGAHCVPTDFVPAALQSILSTCTDGLCAPDTLIATDGNFVPQACFAFTGTDAEGRCLSSCLPGVAAQPSLELSTCTGGDKCAPCFDPFTGISTGSCTMGCDAPMKPAFTFPGCCYVSGIATATCVPVSQLSVPAQGTYSQDDCPTGNGPWRCVPNEDLPGGSGPILCTTQFLGAGACVSRCVNDNPALSQDDCPANYECVPCTASPPGCSS